MNKKVIAIGLCALMLLSAIVPTLALILGK